MSFAFRSAVFISLLGVSVACSGADQSGSIPPVGGTTGSGGRSGTGGGPSGGAAQGGGTSSRGGAVATGGSTATGGAAVASGGSQSGGQAAGGTGSGGAASGGAASGGAASGGAASGGAAAGGVSSGGSTTGGQSSGGRASGGVGTGGTAAGGTVAGGTASGGSTTGGTASGGTASGGAATGGRASGGTATGGTATGGTATGGTATGGTATGGTATGGTATGGTATGGTGTCTLTWNPPSNLSSALDAVWNHVSSTYNPAPSQFRNFIFDQIIEGKGTLNYCIRWDSTGNVSTAQRDQIASLVDTTINAWNAKLAGWGCWPYSKITVTVTGWAVRNASQLAWTTGNIYVNQIRENAPECDSRCGRFFHQEAGYAYSTCPGGAAAHYDMSLWLTDGFAGGAGGDWGQRVAPDLITHIIEHEQGHGYGLDDFYDWDPGVGGFVMMAGSATTITDFDGWMLRDMWRRVIKPRYAL